MRTSIRIALAIVLVTLGASPANAVLTLVEAYVDGQGGVDGLAMAQDVVVSPDGKHVYAVSEGDDAVVRFDRDLVTGTLTFVEAIVDGVDGVTGIAAANAVAVSPEGAHVYVVSGADTGAVAVFARNATSGALTFVEAQKNGQNGVSGLTVGEDVVVSPDGAHVYALGFTPGAVLTFARNPSTGALTFVEKDEEGVNGLDGISFATAFVISPDGANLYVTGDTDDSVAVFARNAATGALTFVEVERDGVGGVDGIDGPFAIGISPDGANVYAGGSNDDGLAVFSRDAVTGALTFVEAFHEGVDGIDGLNFPQDVAVTPDGTHVLVAASAESEVGVFARNSSTGRLTYVESVNGSALGTINSLRFSPGGEHLYATARSSDSVALFDVGTSATTTTTSSTSSSTASTTSGASTTLPPTTTSISTTSSTSVSATTPSSTSATPTTSLGPTTTSLASPTSTTTLPGMACASVPGGSVFEVLECRVAALQDATDAALGLGALRPKLDRAVGKAADRIAAAHGICSFGKAKPARRRLKRAGQQLARYVRRLRGRAAGKAVAPEVRVPLAAAAAAIATDVTVFRGVVVCPGDA